MRRAVLLFSLLLSCIPAWAERVALVIGNASYQNGPLRNPGNDAADMAAKLRGLGFEVISGTNLDREAMVRKVQEFRAALKPGGVGLFFYSGHGVEVGGMNYLLPVNNGAIRTVEDVEIYGLEAQRLVRQMEAAGTQLNVVILDACRDNPLPSTVRSASKGLGRMDAQQGTVVAYATKEGQVAADGSGRNSPYTQALLKYLGQPGLEVSQLFNRVGLEVSTATRGAQVPWVSSSPVPPVMLAGAGVVTQPAPSVPASEGELRIEVSPAGAWVRVDGVLLGTGSRSVKEMAGKTVVVRAEAEGHEPLEERVRVQGGQVADVVLRLKPLAAVQPAPVRPVPAGQDPVPAPSTVRPGTGTIVIDASAPAPAVGQPYRRRVKSGGEGPEMVVVPGGSFLMGSPESEKNRGDDEGPQRNVTIRSFAIGVTELTFADWDQCVAARGCTYRPDDEGWGRGDRPVINVSWEDAQSYATWLSGETGRRYRLPSEAEWEYAARAGTTTAYWWGDTVGRNHANYGAEEGAKGNAEGADRWINTSPVKSFRANPWGLYDTSGNVTEWVRDCHKVTYRDAPLDGSAVEASECELRYVRGAAWYNPPTELRSANRAGGRPSYRFAGLGVRLAEDL